MEAGKEEDMWFIRNYLVCGTVAVVTVRAIGYATDTPVSVTPQQATIDALILAGLAWYIGKEPFRRKRR